MYHCPKCGTPLEYIGKDASVICGSIKYYSCPTCKTIYKEDQSGILASPFNLTEVPEYEIDFVRKSIEHP